MLPRSPHMVPEQGIERPSHPLPANVAVRAPQNPLPAITNGVVAPSAASHSTDVAPGKGSFKGTKDPRKWSPGIKFPTDYDVLSGGRGDIHQHIGNIRFRCFVDSKKELYKGSSMPVRKMIKRSIIAAMRFLDPPSRFLEWDHETELLHEIGDESALFKVSQRLRLQRKSKSEHGWRQQLDYVLSKPFDFPSLDAAFNRHLAPESQKKEQPKSILALWVSEMKGRNQHSEPKNSNHVGKVSFSEAKKALADLSHQSMTDSLTPDYRNSQPLPILLRNANVSSAPSGCEALRISSPGHQHVGGLQSETLLPSPDLEMRHPAAVTDRRFELTAPAAMPSVFPRGDPPRASGVITQWDANLRQLNTGADSPHLQSHQDYESCVKAIVMRLVPSPTESHHNVDAFAFLPGQTAPVGPAPPFAEIQPNDDAYERLVQILQMVLKARQEAAEPPQHLIGAPLSSPAASWNHDQLVQAITKCVSSYFSNAK